MEFRAKTRINCVCVEVMESVRRIFPSNLLFLLALTGSVVGHASLGWYGRSVTEGPRLDREESGQTSIAVQWIAPPPPSSLSPMESIEPLSWEHGPLAVETPEARPVPLERTSSSHRQPLLDPHREGIEPVLATRMPQPQLPLRAPRRKSMPEDAEPRRATQPEPPPSARHQPHRDLAVEPSEVDVPETLVSMQSSGAEVPPSFVSRPLPQYPEHLLLQRIEGVVRLVVTVQRDGRVASAQVYRTSGYPEMDESALRTVRQWIFTPARRGQTAVEDTVIVPVRFQIRAGD